jgi:tight adherence protein C
MDGYLLGMALLAGMAVTGLVITLVPVASKVHVDQWRDRCQRLMRWSVRARYAKQLDQAGIISGLLLWLLTHIWWSLLMGAGLGWLVVGLWVRQKIKQVQMAITQDLPAFLDLLSMCLAAGMNLQTGVQLVLGYQGKSALAALWRRWLLQVRSGTARIDAFKQMLERVQSPSMRRICVALIQAEQSGSGMAASLHAHGLALRQERLMEAEKQALKAPVKMLLPLVVCFFPSTFLVLGFSIYINLESFLD